jgi:hypothetical protein
MLGLTESGPGMPEGLPIGHRAFNSGFKKIGLAPAPNSFSAVLSHLWGSAFNGG